MEQKPAHTSGSQNSSGLGINAILFFGFGLAAGVLVAFSGLGFLQDSAALIATVFLAALLVVLLLGVILYAARRMIWSRLFGFAEVQIEELANPLASVAERAIAGDPAGATTAARDLVALALARYSWITTRRWIIASLIAAMAALAGTALLFQQNQLLAVQSGLLVEQNAKLDEQSVLAALQVQLAEAERNAQIAVQITEIAAELGQVVDREAAEQAAATGTPVGLFNAIRAEDLSRAQVLRITSTSRAAKPYRFLDMGQRAHSAQDNTRIAVKRRRAELPNTYARMAGHYGWTEAGAEVRLIDRAASPERGQLLTALLSAGLLNLEPLNITGLDLSFAQMLNATIILMTVQGGLLDSADFTGSAVRFADFGGASLENARFVGGDIRDSSFAAVTEDRVLPPYDASKAPLTTQANGVDFSGAYVVDTRFAAANMLAARFDGAVLVNADFAQTNLGMATFRDAVLIAPDWTGAYLKATDLDGAIVFGADALATIATRAARDSFRADRFRSDPLDRAALMDIPVVHRNLDLADVDRLTGSAPAFRLTRIQPFDDGAAP